MGNSHSEQVEQQREKTPPRQGSLEKVKQKEPETPKKTDQTETMCLFSTSKTFNHVPCLVKGKPVKMGQASLYPSQASPSTHSQENHVHLHAVATSSAPIIAPCLSQSTPKPPSQEMEQASKTQIAQQRPAVVALKPQVTGKRPAVVAPKPQVTGKRPAVVAPKPQVTQQKPAVVAPKPPVTQERPAVVVPKPKVTEAVKDVRAPFWSKNPAPVETQQAPPTKNIPLKEPEKTACKLPPIRICHTEGTPVVEVKCTVECPGSRLSQSTVDLKDTDGNKGTMKGSGKTPHTDVPKPEAQTPPTAPTNLQGWLRTPVQIRRPDGTTASYDELTVGFPRMDQTRTLSGDPGNGTSTTSREDVQGTSSGSLKAPPNLEQTMECLKDQRSQIPPATLRRQASVKAAQTRIPLSQAFKTTPKFKPAHWDAKAQKAKSSESGYEFNTSAQTTKPAGQPQTNRFPASKPDKTPVTPAAPVLNFPAPIPNNGCFSLGADIPSTLNGRLELSKTQSQTQSQSQNKTNHDEAHGTKTITSSTLTGSNMTSSTLTGNNMSSSTLTDSNVTSSNLTGSNMTSSTLTGSNMTSSTLSGSNVTSSTLTGSNMTCGTLTGSNMTCSTLTGSTMAGSTLIAGTTTSSALTNSTPTSKGELDRFLSKLSPSSLSRAQAARQRLKEMRTRFIKETSKGNTGKDSIEGSPQTAPRTLEPRPAPPQTFEPPRPAPPRPLSLIPLPAQHPTPIYTRKRQQATPPTEEQSPQQKQADVTEALGKANTDCNNLHRFDAMWPNPTERRLDETPEQPGRFQQYASEFHHPDGKSRTDLHNVHMQFHGNEPERLPDPLGQKVTVGSADTAFQEATPPADPIPVKTLVFPIPPEQASTRPVSPPKSRKKQKQAVAQAKTLARSAGKVARGKDKNEGQKTEDIPPASPPSPELPPYSLGRWHPFTVDGSCRRRARCQHGGTNEGLPPNVAKWLNVNRNYLCEPPWVTTAKLAVVLALRESSETSQ